MGIRKNDSLSGTLFRKKAGNYMIFFPSYEMLTSVYGMAEQSNLALVSEIIVQEPSMEERSRGFLEKFQEQSGSRLSVFVFLAVFFQRVSILQETVLSAC